MNEESGTREAASPDEDTQVAATSIASRQFATDVVMNWVAEEEVRYAEPKWSQTHLAAHESFVLKNDLNPIYSYLDRARVLGLDTPRGRQALGKALVTCHHYLLSALDKFGPMPTPGVPSGEVIGEYTLPS